MSAKISSVLQPTKFLLMIMQIIMCSILLKVSDQHVYKSIIYRPGPQSAASISATYTFQFWVWASIICLAIEFLIIFSGKTLFNDSFNVMVITTHGLGLAATGMFMIMEGRY